MKVAQSPIERFASRAVVVASPSESLAQAAQRMRDHGIRHLPVLDGARIVGVLSQRDIYLLESLAGSDAGNARVEEAMTPDPYVVDPEEPIVRVVEHMAQQRLGSAILAHDGRLLGVFTTTDALAAFAALLRDSESARVVRKLAADEDDVI